MKPSQIKETLRVAVAAGHAHILVGAPGVGKSDIVTQIAAELGVELLLFHPVTDDPTDYKGLPFAAGEVARYLPDEHLNRLLEADKPLIAFFDDFGQAPRAVQAACMQLFLARTINAKHVSPHVVFLAATNRREDKAGVEGVLEPVKSRFVSIINVDVDVEDWCEWATEQELSSAVVAFIRWRRDLLFAWKADREIRNSPCPRTVHNVARILDAGYSESLHYELIAGAAGEAFAAEFVGYLELLRQLPEPAEILRNPSGARVPLGSEIGALYAVSTCLASLADEQTFEAVVIYGERLPSEFGRLLITDAVRRMPALIDTRAYVGWILRHQHEDKQ